MIGRAARILDRLVVGVAINIGKSPLFPLEERVELVRAETDVIAARTGTVIEVRPFEGLLVGFAQESGASMIIRGLRAVTDFDYEFQMAGMNRRLDHEIEAVFLMASETNQFISSRFVKEIARLGRRRVLLRAEADPGTDARPRAQAGGQADRAQPDPARTGAIHRRPPMLRRHLAGLALLGAPALSVPAQAQAKERLVLTLKEATSPSSCCPTWRRSMSSGSSCSSAAASTTARRSTG